MRRTFPSVFFYIKFIVMVGGGGVTRGTWWFFCFVLMVLGWGCLWEVNQKQWLWNNEVSKESLSRFSTLRWFYNLLNIWYKTTGYSVFYISIHTYPWATSTPESLGPLCTELTMGTCWFKVVWGIFCNSYCKPSFSFAMLVLKCFPFVTALLCNIWCLLISSIVKS